MNTVLVLGAFGLVGYEVSKHLLNSNCNVIISSRSIDKYSNKIHELKSFGAFKLLAIDASSETSVLSSIDYLCDNNIRLTGVANAASYRPSVLASTSTDVFKDVVLNSSLSIYLPSKLYGDYLASLDGGSIINFSSIYGLGAPLKSLYLNTNIKWLTNFVLNRLICIIFKNILSTITFVFINFDFDFSFQSASISVSVCGFDLNFDFSLLFAVASISISTSVFNVL